MLINMLIVTYDTNCHLIWSIFFFFCLIQYSCRLINYDSMKDKMIIRIKWIEKKIEPACPRNRDPESHSGNEICVGTSYLSYNPESTNCLKCLCLAVSAQGCGGKRERNIIIIIWLISPHFPGDLLFCEGVTESKEDWHDYSTSFALTPFFFLHLLCLFFIL